MIRKDSSSEWIVRDFASVYDHHVVRKDTQDYDVDSQIGVRDFNNLAAFLGFQYCGPRMNALGDNESVFLETSALLPYFPSSTTLCQRTTYWRMYDGSKSKSDVVIASVDNLLLSIFDFCKLVDDEYGWKKYHQGSRS